MAYASGSGSARGGKKLAKATRKYKAPKATRVKAAQARDKITASRQRRAAATPRRSSSSRGLQNYNVRGNNPGGGIGAAFRSFFDIGDFLKGR